MDVSQIYHVPFLPSEWHTVKGAFENRNRATLFEAMQILSAWRLRSSSALPFAVQAAEILIQAVLNDPVLLGEADRLNFLESENVRLVYGMAITRFINYLTEMERQGKGWSIADTAQKYGIPNWVVDVRHAATHGNLPSLNSLREAIGFCWGWLQARYWNHELLDDGSYGVRRAANQELKRARQLMPSLQASTSAAASSTWQLATEDVNWADLPIGLGPGQQLRDLDLRVKPCERNEPGALVQQNNNTSSTINDDKQGGPSTSADKEWDDQKRLDLVQSLVNFVGK